MAEKRRWHEIDRLRGMAILMVLLYHSIIVYPVDLHTIRWCSLLHTFLWTVQMPLFFLVSGFCYSLQGGYRVYALKKCRRILVPHIVFSLLDILPRLIPNPLVHEQMDVREALVDFLLYGGSDWFLWTLFVIVMVFPALEKLLRGGRAGRFAGWLIPAVLFLAGPRLPDLFLMNMAGQYLWYFFLGYILRGLAETKKMPLPGRGVIARTSPVFMLFFFAVFSAATEKAWLPARLLELLCVLCSFIFFSRLASCCRGWIDRFLTACGKWSLQMYLLDAYALVFTRTLLVTVLGLRAPVWVIPGNFIPDTAMVLAVSRYILAKVKLLRMLSGIPETGAR